LARLRLGCHNANPLHFGSIMGKRRISDALHFDCKNAKLSIIGAKRSIIQITLVGQQYVPSNYLVGNCVETTQVQQPGTLQFYRPHNVHSSDSSVAYGFFKENHGPRYRPRPLFCGQYGPAHGTPQQG
jgi:hypothetical protein